MRSKDHKGVVRRRMVSDRSRQFFGEIDQQAATGLPNLRQRIERQTHMQQQPLQQQQTKSEPEDDK